MLKRNNSQPIDEEAALWGSRRRGGYSYENQVHFASVSARDSRTEEINQNLESIQKEIAVIQNIIKDNAQLSIKMQQVSELVMQTKQTSQELSAPIKLPPVEDLEVQLVPTHYLERLEEYRNDENKFALFIGLFGGAILGILSNWFTSEDFTVTRFSIIFLALLIILTVGCILMSIRIAQRARIVKNKMLRSSTHIQVNQDTTD